jgi:hypothetical protein
MANPFADIGRSGIAAIGEDLLQTSVGIRQKEADLAKQNLGMAIDIEQFQTQRQKDQIAIESATLQLEDQKKERARKNVKIPISSLGYQMSKGQIPQELQDHWTTQATEMGLLGQDDNGRSYITVENLEFFMKLRNTDIDFMEQDMKITLGGYEKEAANLDKAIASGEIKGKDLEAAIQRRDQLDGLMTNTYNMVNNEIPAAKDKLKILGTKMQPFVADETVAGELGIEPGDTYFTFGDESGNPMEGAARMTARQHEKATGEKTATVTPKAALDKLQQLSAAKAKLTSGEQMGAAFIAMFSDDPELQALMGSSDPADQEAAIGQIDMNIEYYKQFAPEKYVYTPPATEPEPAAEVEYVPGLEQYEITENNFIKSHGGWDYYEDPKSPGEYYRVKR